MFSRYIDEVEDYFIKCDQSYFSSSLFESIPFKVGDHFSRATGITVSVGYISCCPALY